MDDQNEAKARSRWAKVYKAKNKARQNRVVPAPKPSKTRGRKRASATPATKKRFHILITAYNRPDDLTFLLRDIYGAGGGAVTSVAIHDDASTVHLAKPRALAAKLGWTWHQSSANVGKHGYAAWLASLIGGSTKKMGPDDILVILQDDYRLSEHFFDHAASLLASGIDVLSIAKDERMKRPHWGTFEPRPLGSDLVQTQWADCVFACTRDVATIIGSEPPRYTAQRWADDPGLSSGFGAHVTSLLNRRGKKMAVAAKSIAVHTGTESWMNPTQRQKHPISSLQFVDGEQVHRRLLSRQKTICGLAAIPRRAGQLNDVLHSLWPQVDEVHVYCNNFRPPPGSRVEGVNYIFSRQEAAGDLGDAGKFFATLGRKDCVVLSCDDDLIYPRGYAMKMGRAAMATAPSIICAHGSTLPPRFSSYFQDRTLHHYRDATTRKRIHVPGTGVTAFCGDAIDLELKRDFPTKIMADIHLAVAAKRAGVPVILIEHGKNFVTDLGDRRPGDTLYSRFVRSDKAQNDALKGAGPWH
jgi:hypothetical protein